MRNASDRRCILAIALVAFIAVALVPAGPARADEGMWPLNMLDKSPYAQWQASGLKLDQKDIYNPKASSISDAVVQVGRGTGSFVSPEGLIVTNHHVAFSALQRQSTVDVNYIEDGFLARTRDKEIPALGYYARVLLNIEDVTKKVLSAIKDDMTDLERYKAVEMASKKIVDKAEKGKDLEAEVESIFGGSEYHLYTYFRIKDVRIVYAPPENIGVFGGDEDNWMWPRHTGDFSFLRAYVAPDGSSAEYAEANVPYRPKKYLALSTAPLREGDFAMVLGYPGGTRRYRSSYSIDFFVNKYYPATIKRFEDIIHILDTRSAADPQAAIKLVSTIRSLNNSYKNYQGMLEGLKKARLLEKKQMEEKELRRFLASRSELTKKFGTVLDDIGAQYDIWDKYWVQNTTLGAMMYGTVALAGAHAVYKWSLEREKKDIDRKPGYRDRDEPRMRKQLEIGDLRYDEAADKMVLTYFMEMVASLPEDRQLAVVASVCGGHGADEMNHVITTFIDELYAGTQVTNKEMRMKMFGMNKKELMAMNDPYINFVVQLEEERQVLEEISESFGGATQKLRPKLMELRKLHSGGLLYPDANFTMRMTTGTVRGYAPRDAVSYGYITTLGGVIEKHTGENPFDVPDRLFELAAKEDFGPYSDPETGDVPVCFLSSTDVTGGNSGSTILNGKGEAIGLVFDGNYESISADFNFIPELTRTINVDSRYVLFVVDKFAGAKELLAELTIH
jgi:hypothetical protein